MAAAAPAPDGRLVRARLTSARRTAGEALALGLLQGPAEVLPVSSSGHLALVPRLLGWRYAELSPELRKTFEVAVHAGSGAALALAFRDELFARTTARDAGLLALTLAPAAGVGFVLERPIERRLGGPRSVAVAQIAAGAALALADRAPGRRGAPSALDHLAVGLAQAAALVPGVSRAGAALTVARACGLDRRPAALLARRAAVPISIGAASLKAARFLGGALPPGSAPPIAAGATAAFAATLAASPLAHLLERRSYAPIAAYRIALGAGALAVLANRT